jgi:hypothetical protein
MASAGTFDYVAVVGGAVQRLLGKWKAELRDVVEERGDRSFDDRLVGRSPSLSITDAGPTPNPGWNGGVWLPDVLRSRITLTASERKGATLAAASFYVDKGLTSRVQQGDALHLRRTHSAGLGISIVRGGMLLAAAGAITGLPLGTDVEARCPRDSIEAAQEIFRKTDPSFWFLETPTEVRVARERRLIYRGHSRLGAYDLFAIHGDLLNFPGTDACLAIWRRKVFSESAATSTAQLLDGKAIELVHW